MCIFNKPQKHKIMKKLLFLLPALLLLACSGNGQVERDQPPIISEQLEFYVDTLATGLQNPWGLAFLPDGRILIAERPGTLRVWQNGQLNQEGISGLPPVWAHGQGGLLDVVLHPDFENNQLIYLVHAMRGENGGSTAISRGRLEGNQLTGTETIFHARPHTEAGHHFGSRLVFDGNGYMFSTIGDRGRMHTAQDLGSHNGTVIRLYEDGSVPADNPFVGQEGALPEIWSYGHRNIQGMQLHPETGQLWTHEHGPQGGDEINLIHPGLNYGWPEVTHGINYDGSIITTDTTRAGMEDPILHWTPSIAPCGLSFVSSDKYPGWQGDMLVGALVAQHIHRVTFSGTQVLSTEKLLEGFARFRDIRQGPDGYIYVLTEQPGLFIRITPR